MKRKIYKKLFLKKQIFEAVRNLKKEHGKKSMIEKKTKKLLYFFNYSILKK